MEKAYAKLHGSYEHLEGGHFCEALVDFTGGIPEHVQLSQFSGLPKGLHKKISDALRLGAHAGAEIIAAANRSNTNGLIPGHVYSITGAKTLEGEKITQ